LYKIITPSCTTHPPAISQPGVGGGVQTSFFQDPQDEAIAAASGGKQRDLPWSVKELEGHCGFTSTNGDLMAFK
jgi:hypothetical protein